MQSSTVTQFKLVISFKTLNAVEIIHSDHLTHLQPTHPMHCTYRRHLTYTTTPSGFLLGGKAPLKYFYPLKMFQKTIERTKEK